jgi:hypothetical protein
MALILSGDTGPSFVQAAAMPTGSVIQTVYGTYSGYLSGFSSAAWTSTNVTATITPTSTTSKILILVTLAGYMKNSGTNGVGSFRIVRNSTSVFTWEDLAGYTGNTNVASGELSSTYLDSPATTSATSYTVQWYANNATLQLNNYNGVNGGSTSTITLQEIHG